MDVAGCTGNTNCAMTPQPWSGEPRALRPILGGDLQGRRGSAVATGCQGRLKAMVSEEFQEKTPAMEDEGLERQVDGEQEA